MIQEIKMPSAGQTTDEAKIVAINVKIGDSVKRGDVLVEAETDKAILPVESFAAGQVLDILVSLGDSVDAGTVLAVVGKAGDSYQHKGSSKPAAAPIPAPAPAAPATVPAKVGTEIKMPSAGQTTDEAKIVAVNVSVGDKVKRGDVLVEAETDKAILPVESFTAGQVLDVLVKVGDPVTAGSVLVIVGKPEQASAYVRGGAAAPAPAVSPAPPAPQEEEYRPILKGQESKAVPAPAPVAPAATVYPAMPNAKMVAKERGIDLAEVTASNGVFIKRQDVLAFTPKAAAAPVVEVPTEADCDLLPMTRMRKAIAKRMQQSVNEIPAFQCTVSVDMRRCMALRETFKAKKGIKLSYNDILAKAIAKAAKKYTLINARYEGDEVRIYRHTNIGLAVGLEGALVVPVVKSVEEQGLEAVSAAYKVLVAKARENKLSPADMGCGSITISNLGMYDVDSFTAIVNPPESGILAVGSIKIQPQWDGKEFQPVPMMNITGAFDHRIIDGAYGAQFLQEVKLLMESPELMLG